MKLIPWKINNDVVEGYSVCGEDFNMSFHGDDNEKVLENRKALAAYLNTDLDHMVAPHQTHSTNLRKVSLLDGGEGMYQISETLDNVDATYTKDANLTLLSFHADCTPVLLYSPSSHLIAAIHSGWRGTVNEIVGKSLDYLIQNENVNPEDIYAYIGPSLSQKNFEAMDDIIDLVKKMSFDTSSYYIKKDETHYLLDSKGLIKKQLLLRNVKEENIDVSPFCTYDNDLFYSYRKNKTRDRHITIVRLKK